MDWRSLQRKNFTCIDKLCAFLELDEANCKRVLHSSKFALNLPLRLAQKIAKNDLDDPLFRQFVPLTEETNVNPGYSFDPVQDGCARKSRKLLHKYQGRALLLATSACVMHCRFCFRQKFDYETEQKFFEEELSLVAQDSSIKEIILSGGDPLSLSNATLKQLFDRLAGIPHLSLIRFHTRFPIGIPERIDTEFLEILAGSRLQVWMVIHCNHPLELDQEVITALKKVQKQGVPVLNQGVLLKGINDSFEVQKTLLERFIDNGIVPYYLHQLDRVEGTAHFEVSQEEGIALIEKLRASLPGYAIPRFVAEIPHRPSKTPLT